MDFHISMRRPVGPWLPLTVAALLGVSPLSGQSNPGSQAAAVVYPTKDRWGKPLPALTFFCQYAGLAKDASGKYPVYQNAMFTMATSQGAVSTGWKNYIEETYHPASLGNPMCALVPDDPAEREGVLKTFNLLTQPATQVVVKTNWKP